MLFLLATLAAAPSVVPPPAAAARQSCPRPQITFTKSESRGNGLRRLGEEPPASHYLAVMRDVGGCPAPAVVRTGIGR